MNNPNKAKLLLVSVALMAAMLACNLPGGANTPAEPPIPVSSQAVDDLTTQVAAAAATAQAGGAFTLEMTEQQLTSAAAMELQSTGDTQIRDIQVRLPDGRMVLSGTTTQSGVNLPVTITLTFTVDANGNPHSQVIDAKVGPFGMPQSVIDQIQARLDTMVLQQLGGTNSTIAVDSITIAGGKLVIAAHRR